MTAERLGWPIYNSMWRLRRDSWSDLAELCATPGWTAASARPTLDTLEPIEQYWAYPGPRRFRQLRNLLAGGENRRFAEWVIDINNSLATESYRRGTDRDATDDAQSLMALKTTTRSRPYFEVLVVGEMSSAAEEGLRAELRRLRRPDDAFAYELVVVTSFTDALTAALFNFNVQACVIWPRFGDESAHDLSALGLPLDRLWLTDPDGPVQGGSRGRALELGRRLHAIRPELDLYLMADRGIERLAGKLGAEFRRVFHTREGALELHLSVLRGIEHRYRTPFFEALRDYSRQPTGVFHALPVSRGKSVLDSHWIAEMVEFYGLNIFLAETSATCGGLDSLLEPTGPLRQAQELAAETFGSQHTFWVTNGTSTANKIVLQALVRPGDIVLVDRNCHQSHHYGLVLAGADVCYLDAYPLHQYGMYGAVPIREIKRNLLELRRAGKLDRVKMVMLTNCTFDGVVYDVERVMQECLAIKPDLVFLWDEAWFAFARFHPVYRSRTAMAAAAHLLEGLRRPEQWPAQPGIDEADSDAELLERRLWPDPANTRVRVYATQSTHKTLTSLRQGSMIHIFDQDYPEKVRDNFRESYMAHTSTSPNYQILASLDLGRRQAALEGLELVQKQVECAMSLRDAIDDDPLLSRYVRCLTTADLIPAEYRPAGIDQPLRSGLSNMMAAWRADEFVLDPCRITLSIAGTGIQGDTFKRTHLMDRFGVQVNKTTPNTVLFMTTIGTSRSSVAYLIEVLTQIVREIDEQRTDLGAAHRAAAHAPTAPLPDFSEFHEVFRGAVPDAGGAEGDIRRAFFTAYDDSACEYLSPAEVTTRLASGEQVVSATFVTPYPPGFPILVPGQCFSQQILEYMSSLDTPEIHGYQPELGYRVFTEKALHRAE